MDNDNRLKEKIAETRARLNLMEMVDEIESADTKQLAQKVYYNRLTDGVGAVVSEAVDRYFSDPEVRISVANEILEKMELEPISLCEGMSNEDIFDEYISRF